MGNTHPRRSYFTLACLVISAAFILSLSANGLVQAAPPSTVPETEPNDTVALATALPILPSAYAIGTGTINPGGDVDFWFFTAPAGATAWISTDTGGTQNAGSTSRDTVIDLYAADGTTVIENDDDDGTGNGCDGTVETGLASLIGGRSLTAGGTYYIRVRSFSATAIINPYKLLVAITTTAATPETEPNDTAATANNFVPTGTAIGLASGAINVAGDKDYYAINATAGSTIFVNADGDPERDGIGTDMVLELRDSSTALLLSADSSITGSVANPAAEDFCYLIPTTGIYYVNVRHFSATGTGTYKLMVAVEDTALSPTSTPTSTPTDTPTNTPTNTPTDTPTNTPTNTPTDTPTDTPTSTPTSTATPSSNRVYLPLIIQTGLPDLVGSLSISPDKRAFRADEPVTISVTITNRGSAPSPSVWADLSINPTSPPTAANMIWNLNCNLTPCYGISWVVPALAPGQSITLTSTAGSYAVGYTIWPGTFAHGTSDLYLFVDSWNPGVVAGAAAESDETNNRAELHGLTVTGPNPPAPAISTGDLPPRPAPGAQRIN